MNTKIIAIIVAAIVVIGAAIMIVPRFLEQSTGTNRVQSEDAEPAEAEGEPDDATETITEGPFTGAPIMPEADDVLPTVAQQLDEAARQVNAEAPITIDAVTNLTAASVSGRRLRYRYALTREINTDQRERMEQQFPANNRQALCGQPAIRSLIEQGAEFEYVYYDAEDGFIFNNIVSNC